MSLLKKSLFIATAALALSNMAQADNIKPISTNANSLTWSNVPTLPGTKFAVLAGNPEKKEFFVVRLILPANYSIAMHHHLINEYDTIISGTFYLGSGEKADKSDGVALTPGSFVTIPAKSNHYGWTKEETVLQISGIGPWGAIYNK